MNSEDLGASEFTFAGGRTWISDLTDMLGPITEGSGQQGRLSYQEPECDRVFSGNQVTRLDSALGTLLTIQFRPDADAGAIKIILLVPKAHGVTRQQPVAFGTIALKTTSHGSRDTRGVQLTCDVLPLVAKAQLVISPLTDDSASAEAPPGQ